MAHDLINKDKSKEKGIVYTVYCGVRCSHCVSEEKPRVAEGHVFEQAVEVSAGERAPGTLHVSPRLSLLESAVVVEKVVHCSPSSSSSSFLHCSSHWWRCGSSAECHFC